MILAWWAETLQRPELHWPVPAVARDVYDPQWPGTGNWPFNTALAGAQPSLSAIVTRLSEIDELETLLRAKIPVAASVSFKLLHGVETGDLGEGHIVVVTGISNSRDVFINDPGVRLDRVQQTIPRKTFDRAWQHSRRTVYLVWPRSWRLPTNSFEHW